MREAGGKTKIAILGGGVGALAAAFDLTEADPAGELFDITIHQVGWRLGGKGAVGWTCEKYPTPTFEKERLQLEHGLHVWAGFYDNAFDLLKRCYAGVDGGRSYLEAFTPVRGCWVMDQYTGAWEPWGLSVPPNQRIPGISRSPPSTSALWGRLLALVIRSTRDKRLRQFADRARTRIPALHTEQSLRFARKAREVVDQLAVHPMGVGRAQRARFRDLVRFAIDHVRIEYFDPKGIPPPFDAPTLNEEVRRLAITINIGLALLVGMLDCRVLSKGFDAIDDMEWSRWMYGYGAWEMSLKSGLVRGFYDYVFGFKSDGKRAIAAGTSTRAFLRLVGAYKGSLFYKLNVTMGEFLFAPLYELLVQRKVKFEFFHRVDKLQLSADKKTIAQIDIGVQARLKEPNRPYDPLIETPDEIKSWPDRPDYDQLESGDQIYATLLAEGQDLESPWNSWGVVESISLKRDQGHFDKVILGISLGALKDICSDLCNEPDLRWREMIDNVQTCPTLAAQLWVDQPATALGWPTENSIVTAFANPLNTWGDNSQLIAYEAWTDREKPSSLGYFVGNLSPDEAFPQPNLPSDFPVIQLRSARASLDEWLQEKLPALWPGYDQTRLAHDAYVRVNVNPSDRYVQSVPGSVEHRLAPDGSGVDNLFLAGDWVRIGLNAGCIEQAVLGGRAAARAITGVNMNGLYDNDRNWDDDTPVSPAVAALLSNLPDLTRLALAGIGTVEACCIVQYVTTKLIKAMLPSGLTLGPPAGSLDTVPICLVFAKQRNVRPGFLPFGGIGYLEFAIVFNNVYNHDTADDYKGPFVYMPRLLLNSFPPVAIGVAGYGFNKRLARIRQVGDSFDIQNDEGEISARFENASLLGQIGNFPALSIVKAILDQPVISETSDGGWITSQLDYHMDVADFQALQGHCSIKQGPYESDFDFIPAPPRAPKGALPLPQIAYGFRMVTNWDITLPMRIGEHIGLLPSPKRMHAAAMTSRLIRRFRGRA
jgi:uncharacterized protein with NAD-binding domain and iron-sulfur cluster